MPIFCSLAVIPHPNRDSKVYPSSGGKVRGAKCAGSNGEAQVSNLRDLSGGDPTVGCSADVLFEQGLDSLLFLPVALLTGPYRTEAS